MGSGERTVPAAGVDSYPAFDSVMTWMLQLLIASVLGLKEVEVSVTEPVRLDVANTLL